MLESFRRGQRWLTLTFVTVIGGVFVFFMGGGGGISGRNAGGGNGTTVVALGDIRLDYGDFQRQRRQQEAALRQRIGEQFDARTMAPFIDSQTLRSLEELAILADSARDLGLAVSDEEIRRIVLNSPTFRNESGKFDRKAFEGYASYEYGSQRLFVETMRRDLLQQKMLSLLYNQASISHAEARDAALYAMQEARIAYVKLDRDHLSPDDAVSDEEVAAYVESHNDALRAQYEERLGEFREPERARARHLLVTVESDAGEAVENEARQKIEALRARIVAGEAFEDVAREATDDAGTRERGGDLGIFARGSITPALESAAFSLEAGDLSDPIRSDVGYHLVRVEERLPAVSRSFDDVRDQLGRQAATREKAERLAREKAETLSAAVRAGQSLEDAAREAGLTLERTALLRRRTDGFIPGLGASPELLSAAFGLSPESPSSPEIFEVGRQLVLAQQLELVRPSEEDLEAAVAQQTEALLDAKRGRVIQEWIDQRRAALSEEGRLEVNAGLVISNT